jgi:hypothetical protein
MKKIIITLSIFACSGLIIKAQTAPATPAPAATSEQPAAPASLAEIKLEK